MNLEDLIKKAVKQLEELNELIRIEKEKSSVKSEFEEAYDKLINFIRNNKNYAYKKCRKDNSSFTPKEGVFDSLNSAYKDQKYLVIDCADNEIFFSNDLDDAYHMYDTYIIEIKTKHIYNVQKVGFAETFDE